MSFHGFSTTTIHASPFLFFWNLRILPEQREEGRGKGGGSSPVLCKKNGENSVRL